MKLHQVPPTWLFLASILVAFTGPFALGQTSGTGRTIGPVKQRWEVGLVITGGSGTATSIVAAAPVPTVWPEQQVEVVDQQVTDNIGRLAYRTVGEGAKQMVIRIPKLAAGEEATALLTLEITRGTVDPPMETDALRRPKRKTRELIPYLSDSPLIETRNKLIRDTSADVVAGEENDWARAEAIYDFVLEKVAYQEGSLKGALAALRDGSGDCEERTSLFIALCRAEGIPARTVWVPGHCYPEFYLQDDAGDGHWIPCQSAGEREFGHISDRRPILQKGDSFKLPEYRQPLHYARATLQAGNIKGRVPPTVRHIQRMVPTP